MSFGTRVNGSSRKCPNPFHPRSGFTLVELLVVVALIAVIAALLLPAISKAKFHGKNTACRNNLRQLALAANLYASLEGIYPPWLIWTSPNGQVGADWRYLLDASRLLARSSETHHCPMYQGIVPDSYGIAESGTNVSYCYNKTGVAGVTGSLGLGGCAPIFHVGQLLNVTRPTRESDVKIPSEMIAFADCAARTDSAANPVEVLNGEMNPRPVPNYQLTGFNEAPGTRQPTFQVHRGRFNRSFCDGHVEADNMNRFLRISDDYLKRFNIDYQPHLEAWGP